jgi:hypothetical protein
VKSLFLLLLAVHLLYSLLFNLRWARRRVEPSLRAALVTQTPAFILACYLGFRTGILSGELLAPWWIAAGLLGGHLIFCLSLLVTHGSFRDAGLMLKDVDGLWNYGAEHPEVLFRFLGVGVAEEMVWRVGAQPILAAVTGQAWIGIALAAAGFAVVHKHFFTNPLIVSVEFVLFALLLGVLFHVTASFTLIVLIHAMRDIEIAYLEHVIKTEHPEQEEQLPAPARTGGRPLEIPTFTCDEVRA